LANTVDALGHPNTRGSHALRPRASAPAARVAGSEPSGAVGAHAVVQELLDLAHEQRTAGATLLPQPPGRLNLILASLTKQTRHQRHPTTADQARSVEPRRREPQPHQPLSRPDDAGPPRIPVHHRPRPLTGDLRIGRTRCVIRSRSARISAIPLSGPSFDEDDRALWIRPPGVGRRRDRVVAEALARRSTASARSSRLTPLSATHGFVRGERSAVRGADARVEAEALVLVRLEPSRPLGIVIGHARTDRSGSLQRDPP